MDYQDLKDSINRAPSTSRLALERLFLEVTSGRSITPEWSPYLDGAKNHRDFFDAIYDDDGKKDTLVWAEWARMSHKGWINRFEPDICLQNVITKADGLPIGFESGVMLAPTGSRDTLTSFYVFKSNAFNTSAAEFVTSIGGAFCCAGYAFLGVYGLYRYRGNVILEGWQAERPPRPLPDVLTPVSADSICESSDCARNHGEWCSR